MKIFNRGTDAKPAPATGPAMPMPPASAPPGAVASSMVPMAAMPSAPPAAPEPEGPDLSALLDANVKEMSEKIARLAGSIESQQADRGSFEAKLEQMEERMRKLSSLTEMISAQYNPFVGDAPTERDVPPQPEIGLAAPPVPAPTANLSLDAPGGPSLGIPSFADMADLPSAQPVVAAPAVQAPPAAPPQEEPHGVFVWAVPPGFESSILLLGWADMLLKSAGSRESLLELVNYYHNIGWIGDVARDQLLAYADGITAPSAAVADWRADVEVHEKSLLFVEKLRAVQRRG